MTEYGIFLPIGNGGWLVSESAPHPEATYETNRRAAVVAEEAGLDFVMSMAKWRGFGGSTDHWGRTLESMVTMAGIAEATSRVKVWATMHANVHHPAVAAKMMTTLQQVSGGRAGINIVNGAYPDEFVQWGMWDATLSHADRYRMSEEWTEALVRLWTEDRVTMHSDFFTLDDCESRPHPVPLPTIISAGRSADARAYQARWADGAFLGADDLDEMRVLSRDVHERAAANGRTCRTYAMLTVVQGDTDAEAQRLVAEYGAGLDRAALTHMRTSWGIPEDQARAWAEGAQGEAAFQTPYVAGDADRIAEHVHRLVGKAELDGLMLIFPEYDRDLAQFGESVLPRLREMDEARSALDAAAAETVRLLDADLA